MIIVRFSRPLLLIADIEANKYATVYGFVIDWKVKWERIKCQIDDYVSYLAGMHCCANGGDEFSATDDYIPDWIDRDGYIHTIWEKWVKEMGRKCRQKLHLTYDVITADLDDDYCAKYLDEGIIVSNDFYEELAAYVKNENTNKLVNTDDLPLP